MKGRPGCKQCQLYKVTISAFKAIQVHSSAWLGPVTEAMLDQARLEPGDRVLDLAAGAGEPSLSAAEKVGPSGHVLATDISSNILGFAAKTARERGLTNFETRVMDGEKPGVADETFDAVLSRLGLIYFPDRKGAMRAAHHAQGRRCQRDQSQTQWWNLLSLTALSITRLYGP